LDVDPSARQVERRRGTLFADVEALRDELQTPLLPGLTLDVQALRGPATPQVRPGARPSGLPRPPRHPPGSAGAPGSSGLNEPSHSSADVTEPTSPSCAIQKPSSQPMSSVQAAFARP
jgi:hypothetical protein